MTLLVWLLSLLLESFTSTPMIGGHLYYNSDDGVPITVCVEAL